MTPNPLQDPQFLPFKLDLAGARVLLVRLDARQRADAAFLDERALPAAAEGYWTPLDAWLAAPGAHPAMRLDWIFHIGHCGSTLLSRLLQAWPGVAPLREPLPLRSLAAVDAPPCTQTRSLLHALVRDWTRPLPPATRILVKATSSCNALAGDALGLNPDSRALWLDMALEPWLATILKSPGSIADALAATPERIRLLAPANHDDLARELRMLPPHRQCALGWAAERLRRMQLSVAAPGRVLHVDFDHLLAHPEAALSGIAGHLGLDRARIAEALSSPWWRRYSKAGEHAYAAVDRAADLALARARFGDMIGDARSWLDSLLARHPHMAGPAAPDN